MTRQTCGDCGCLEGELHMLGCDQEECPYCGNQLIGCVCKYRAVGLYHPIKYKETAGVHPVAFRNGLSDYEWEKWLGVLKRRRIPFVSYPNMCAKCGKVWPDMFRVPDEEWRRYVPISHRREMLCRKCYGYIKRVIDAA